MEWCGGKSRNTRNKFSQRKARVLPLTHSRCCLFTLPSQLAGRPDFLSSSFAFIRWALRGVQAFGISGPQQEKKSCPGPHIKCTVTCNHSKKKTNLFMFYINLRLCVGLIHIRPGPHKARGPGVGNPARSRLPHSTHRGPQRGCI